MRALRKIPGVPLLLLGVFSFLLPSSALSWGSWEHQVCGEVAELALLPAARRQIDLLLGPGVRLSQVANWADEIKRARRETGPWHYVNYPLRDSEPGFSVYEADEGNVVTALEEQLRRAGDWTLETEKRAEALKFVVHFVGDIHQPMHCAAGEDRGGNTVVVFFDGSRTNYHSVWDSRFSGFRDRSPELFALRLWELSTPGFRERAAAGSPYDWMVESHVLARDFAYPLLEKARSCQRTRRPELSGVWARAARPLIMRRLFVAGVRLAAALNRTLVPPPPTPAPPPPSPENSAPDYAD